MDKYHGGTEMYMYDTYWFSKDKIFNIDKIRSLLEKNSDFENNELDKIIEKIVMKSLDNASENGLYKDLDDEIKDNLGSDIKEVMRIQKILKI